MKALAAIVFGSALIFTTQAMAEGDDKPERKGPDARKGDRPGGKKGDRPSREEMRKKFESMSEEEKEAFKKKMMERRQKMIEERTKNMSEEETQSVNSHEYLPSTLGELVEEVEEDADEIGRRKYSIAQLVACLGSGADISDLPSEL